MENNLNNRMNEKVLPIVAAVVGHSIWGFSYLFTRMALSVTSPDVLLTVRFSIAFLILNILILTGKFKLSLKGKSAGHLGRLRHNATPYTFTVKAMVSYIPTSLIQGWFSL